jgi:hypothetical protein
MQVDGESIELNLYGEGLKGRIVLPVMFACWMHPAASSLGIKLGVRLLHRTR